MEFNEKLQLLRKQKGLTQEELAASLYVSRTAVSKWESGRGFPNLDSLKAIAKFYGVTIDGLLSGEDLLSIAENDARGKEKHYRDLVFGMLDCGCAMLFVLPLFGEKSGGGIRAVDLLTLGTVSPWLRTLYCLAVMGMTAVGIATLALRNRQPCFWEKIQRKLSCLLNVAGVLLFTVSLQPYAAAVLLLFLAIKALMLIKWQ